MTKSRVFVWGLLVFIGGIGLRSFVMLPIFVVLVVGLFAVTAITIGLLRRSARTILYGSLLILFLFGVLRFELAASLRPDLTPWYGKQFVMQGVVAAEPEF
ncbi:MAG: hypothetical protein HY006_02150, partial [Candidatus Sungbacteria bacterium]|nr:hypothetical protein [Candidatus Sungbacteria bacterium]